MYRIFISHSHSEVRQARALKKYLVKLDPPLANEIFLDSDRQHGIRAGQKWKAELRRAMASCEAVICLVSDAWNSRAECLAEFRTAENLDKRIFCARLEETQGVTDEYQRVDLFGDGDPEIIDLEDGEPPVAFLADGLHRLKDEIIEKGIGPESFVWPPPTNPERAPYRGWEPLDEVDAAVYFGRDAEIIRATDMLRGMRKPPEKTLFVVLGPSGAGKSSFLRAGLLPRLRRADRDFVVLDRVIRPEANALTGEKGLATSISATLKKAGITEFDRAHVRRACLQDTAEVRHLLSRLQRTAARPRADGIAGELHLPTVVIPVDQAEELFSKDAGPEAARFLELVNELALASPDGDDEPLSLIVALTIRTDHHEALQTARQLANVPSVVFDDLKPLPAARFREVIVGPANRAGESGERLEIEEGLVNELLADCQEGADTLPLLALTLARLHADYSDDGKLELREYRDMGGVRDVVQNVVDTILTKDPETRAERLKVLRPAFIPWLATISRQSGKPVRRLAEWKDLPPEAKPLLSQFVEKRLLVQDKRSGGETVEVALESLLRQWKELKEWLDDEADNLKQTDALKQSAQEWSDQRRDVTYLWSGERLIAAEELLRRPDYHEHLASAQEFVAESRRHAKGNRRKKNLVRVGLAAAVVVALVAGFVGWQLYASYKQNVAQRLVTTAAQMLDGGRAGGDVLALQLLLAADYLGTNSAATVVDARRDLVRIMENPPSPNGGGVMPVWGVAVDRSVDADGEPRSKYVASANNDGVVRLWSMADGKPVKSFDLGGVAQAVAFNPGGSVLAAGSNNGTLKLWDVESGQPAGPALQVDGGVTSVAFSRDGRLVAAGSSNGAVRVWNVADGNPLVDERVLPEGAPVSVTSVAFPPPELDTESAGPAATTLVTGDDSGWVQLWNALGNGAPLARWQSGDPDTAPVVTSVAVSAHDMAGANIVAAALADGSIALLDGNTLVPTPGGRFRAHSGPLFGLAFSPGGTRIASVGSDNAVRVWDAQTGKAIGAPLIGHHGAVYGVTFNADATKIVSGGSDGSIREWDAVSGLPIPANQGAAVRSVAFRPRDPGAANSDGVDEIASGGTDGTVKLWNPTTGAPTGALGLPSTDGRVHAVNSLAYSPHGDRLVTGGFDGTVALWELSSDKQLPRVRPAPNQRADAGGQVRSIAFSADGAFIVAGDDHGVLTLWDGHTLAKLGSATLEIRGDDQHRVLPVWSVAFGGSDRVASGAGINQTGVAQSVIQLWKVNAAQPPGRVMTEEDTSMKGNPGRSVYTIQFDHDDKTIAAGTNDGTITLFDAATGQQLGDPMSGDQNAVMSLAFASKNPWIVSGAQDGKVRFWDSVNHEPIGTPIEAHDNWVHSVAISPDEDVVVSGGADATIHLWPAPQSNVTKEICAKLNTNMSHRMWTERVSGLIPYQQLCPGLGIAPD